MVNYNNAKIYKIVDNKNKEYYIGSTTKSLAERMAHHRYAYKNGMGSLTSYNLFDKYGLANCKIQLLMNYPCNNRKQLEKKEGELIRDNECINKYVAGRTKKEYNKEHKDI
jgi:hypothetical protein